MNYKNILKFTILGLLAFFMNLMYINAASASISVSSSSSKVVIGNTVTVTIGISSPVPLGSWQWTLDYSSSLLKFESGQISVADYGNGSKTSASYTYKFKAIASGSATVGVKAYNAYGWDESALAVSAGSKSIKIISQAELEASYSKDNTLKSLSVDGTTLDPEFNKDTKDYVVKVNSTTEKVMINATPNDNAASVSGTGEFPVSEGENKFEVIVTAENGSKNTYTLLVVVEDPNPINVKTVEGKKLSIVKRASSLTKPNTYEEKTIVINEIEVPCFYSEITKITLVGLKDEDAKIALYVYDKDNNSYTLYKEIKFNNTTIYPLSLKENEKFINYSIKKVKINNEAIEAYKLTGKSNYSIFYGINIENNKKGYFVYDSKNSSVIEYTSEEIDLLNDKLFNYKKIIIVLIGESVILLMIVLFVSTHKNKKLKKLIGEIKNYQDKENLNSIKNIEDKSKIKNESKKTDKKLEEKQNKVESKKDKKIKEKEAKKTNRKKKNDLKKLDEL